MDGAAGPQAQTPAHGGRVVACALEDHAGGQGEDGAQRNGPRPPALPHGSVEVQVAQVVAQDGGPTMEGEGGAALQLLASSGILELPQGLSTHQEYAGPKYKRGRGRSFFREQPKKGAVCQVPNCDRSLHKLRDYYKRYKICPYHLELPCLVVEGQLIRFCQQCGRFQLLSDFEGDRRSCRKKLDKHNERRRKAEAEQRARLLDSGSDDSPGGTRGAKAHRPSPYAAIAGAAGGSPSLHTHLGLGSGLGDRMLQLATEPAMQDLPASLLESLMSPATATGADWAAAGSLGSLGGLVAPPLPQPEPTVLPPELLQLLPPEAQQLVLQQGAGVLNSALLAHLRGEVQHMTAAPPPPQPPLLLGGHAFQPAPAAASLPTSAFSSPAAAMLSPVASRPQATRPPPPPLFQFNQQQQQHQAQYHQQLQQQQYQEQQQQPPGGPTRTSATSLLQRLQQAQLQQQQQAHHQQQRQQQQASPLGVPLLHSQAAAKGQAGQADGSSEGDERATLLVELARHIGVSNEDLTKAASKVSAPQDSPASTVPLGGDHAASAPHISFPRRPSPAHPQLQHVQQQQQQGSDSRGTDQMQASQASQPAALAPPSQPSLDSLPRHSSGGVTSLPTAHPQQPLGSAFLPPPPQQQQQPDLPAMLGSVVAAVAAAAGPPPAQPAASSPLVEMGRLQHAVQNGGLSPGFASDASLLVQLVEAVRAAQEQAGASSDRMRSLCLKLFNATPESLPKNILDELQQWMAQNGSLLDGASRPGCVQLSMSALMSGAELRHLAASLAAMAQQLACGALGNLNTGLLARVGDHAVLVDGGGGPALPLDLASSGAAVPEIASVRPVAVTPGYRGPILVTGRHVGGPGDAVFCRNAGHYPTTEVLGSGQLLAPPAGRGDGMGWVLLRIPSLQEGCHQIEAQRGLFVSAPHSLLVLDDAAAAAELRQLELPGCSVPEPAELLHRLGAVLRFGRGGERARGAADPALLLRIDAAAQELAATCILLRWGAVLRLVLPSTCSACSPQQAAAAIERHLRGLPLLHAAALMGGAGAVRALGAWAAAAGLELPLGARWGGGLTAMHVAALLREPEEVAVALTELSPAAAAEHWASALSLHGSESPLGLACHLDRRGLLRALRDAGVAEAGAMLAALQLQDEPPPPPLLLPLGVEGTAQELDRQRRQWTKVYGSIAAEPPAARAAAPPPARTWPLFGGGAAGRAARQAVAPPLATSPPPRKAAQHGGDQSPSSVLTPPDRFRPASCRGEQARMGIDPLALASGPLAEETAWKAAAAAAAARAAPPPGVPAGKPPGDAAEQPRQGQQPARGGSEAKVSGGSGLPGGEWAPPEFKAPAQALPRALHKRHPGWTSPSPAKGPALLYAALLVAVGALLAAAPGPMRARTQLWLFATVARAPLLFQPLLLFVPAARAFCRTRRPAVVVAAHSALLALQSLVAATQADSRPGPDQLLSPGWLPLGLWLGLILLTLQLRLAVQSPALLAMYCSNMLLLPAASRRLAAAWAGAGAC